MRTLKSSIIVLAVLFLGVEAASGQVVTFGSFNEFNANVVYVDNGPVSATMSGTFTTNWLSAAVYTNAAQAVAPAYPGFGIVPAQVNFSITTTVSGTGGGNIDQPFTSSVGVMTINSLAPINGLTNLLTMQFTGSFNGTTGGQSGTFSGSSSGNTVIYTSQFVTFDNTQARSYSGGLNQISPILAINGSFMDSWTAVFAQFSFAAAVQQVPEPSTLLLVGAASALATLSYRRRMAKKAAEEKAATTAVAVA